MSFPFEDPARDLTVAATRNERSAPAGRANKDLFIEVASSESSRTETLGCHKLMRDDGILNQTLGIPQDY